ncbi:histidine kinase [Pseudoalteromonas sp. NBT06-2]|uniref:exopolysaccharide Pel transporter PelG n=1 Tax=Pseudoalteromonas sp. NBT06-2 TaxID=2025950 RepID=UPI000BA73D79|nr:exopolysaccharide Pel transporter PelG [Pseudoalteromonas sp. NBT06-2]PAJ73876.1 histidine kinase [Pseudoalteromonas sp. NBT06-2]
MAGIGFELRKILKKRTLLSILEAYGLAGVVSSGPWVLSIVALMAIGFLSIGKIFPESTIIQFLVIVTYLMAGSLILSGLFQLMLTRFISDQLFQSNEQSVTPNLLGCMVVSSLLSLILGIGALSFSEIAPAIKLVILTTFVILCNLWLIIIFLSGMKQYYRIFLTLFMGYSLMVVFSIVLPPFGILGLLVIFALSQALITFFFLFFVLRYYPSDRLVSFEFLNHKKIFLSLVLCGVIYNIGVWVDKFFFWINQDVSFQVIDIFYASYIYDLPIFIAYLAIIPGMAVFMMHMETDFARSCENFYKTVREGGTLQSIFLLKDKMVLDCKNSIYQIFKVQGITLTLLLLWCKDILEALSIDFAYLHLLYVDLVGVSLQVMVMAILNVMFYLDKRYAALILVTFIAVTNFSLTQLSINLGPEFYGYGFAVTMLLTTLLGLVQLNNQFNSLEYHTFMLQE